MLLVIETATAALSVALLQDGELLAEHHEIVGRGHAERLLPVVQTLLGQRVPDEIAVDCGPGSFTGIRVGLAAAQGLRIAWQIPASGFSQTALVLAGIANQPETYAVALEGGHGELFVEMFAGEPLRSIAPLRSLAPHAAAQAIAQERIYGSGAAAVVESRGWGLAIDAPPKASEVRWLPARMTSLALRPLYGREPDARPPL